MEGVLIRLLDMLPVDIIKVINGYIPFWIYRIGGRINTKPTSGCYRINLNEKEPNWKLWTHVTHININERGVEENILVQLHSTSAVLWQDDWLLLLSSFMYKFNLQTETWMLPENPHPLHKCQDAVGYGSQLFVMNMSGQYSIYDNGEWSTYVMPFNVGYIKYINVQHYVYVFTFSGSVIRYDFCSKGWKHLQTIFPFILSNAFAICSIDDRYVVINAETNMHEYDTYENTWSKLKWNLPTINTSAVKNGLSFHYLKETSQFVVMTANPNGCWIRSLVGDWTSIPIHAPSILETTTIS